MDGERKYLSEWCREYGISKQCVYRRLCRGWPIELAIVKPVRRYGHNKLRDMDGPTETT
jgi:hypothetical protein